MGAGRFTVAPAGSSEVPRGALGAVVHLDADLHEAVPQEVGLGPAPVVAGAGPGVEEGVDERAHHLAGVTYAPFRGLAEADDHGAKRGPGAVELVGLQGVARPLDHEVV